MDVLKLSSSLVSVPLDKDTTPPWGWLNEAVYLAYEAGNLVALHDEICGTACCDCASKLARLMTKLHDAGYTGEDYKLSLD